MPKIETLLGPPGTGKTTTLLNQIESLLAAGVRPDEIAFVSYTKAATNEAIERASKRFDIDPDAFVWFKTIHAMARRAMAEKLDVMKGADWKSFGEGFAYSFTDAEPGEENLNIEEDGDCLRHVTQLARVMRCPIGKAIVHAGEVPPHLTECSFELYSARLKAWKADNRKIDFVDMLEAAIGTAWRPPVRFAFVDEAQDNTRLQNSLCKHWFWENSRCERVVHAGDDDQEIYTWSGAQPGALIWIANHSDRTVLEQSYRVPRRPHSVAQSIIRQNKHRIAKDYRPRDDEGQLLRAGDAADALSLLGEGTSIALVRNVMFATKIRESCMESGRLFSCEVGAGSPLHNSKDARGAFGAVASWQSGTNASAREYESLLELVPSRHGNDALLPRGAKARSKENRDPVPLWRARDLIGAVVENFLGEQPFALCLKLDTVERGYLTRVLASDPHLRGRVLTVTSIHRSKGREADNVIIVPNMANRTSVRFRAGGFEEENRVAYVAETRSRRTVIHVEPSWRTYYPFARFAA
jgi:superfamily I DNA/RNA helicase